MKDDSGLIQSLWILNSFTRTVIEPIHPTVTWLSPKIYIGKAAWASATSLEDVDTERYPIYLQYRTLCIGILHFFFFKDCEPLPRNRIHSAAVCTLLVGRSWRSYFQTACWRHCFVINDKIQGQSLKPFISFCQEITHVQFHGIITPSKLPIFWHHSKNLLVLIQRGSNHLSLVQRGRSHSRP